MKTVRIYASKSTRSNRGWKFTAGKIPVLIIAISRVTDTEGTKHTLFLYLFSILLLRFYSYYKMVTSRTPSGNRDASPNSGIVAKYTSDLLSIYTRRYCRVKFMSALSDPKFRKRRLHTF